MEFERIKYSRNTKQTTIKKYTLIKDGRTLKSFIKHGFINNTKYGIYPQIEHNNNDDWRFTYKNINYELKYIDGSIYPMLFKTEINIINNVEIAK